MKTIRLKQFVGREEGEHEYRVDRLVNSIGDYHIGQLIDEREAKILASSVNWKVVLTEGKGVPNDDVTD